MVKKECVNKYENFKIVNFDSDQKCEFMSISDMSRTVHATKLIARDMGYVVSI